jgi:hypothetical protein
MKDHGDNNQCRNESYNPFKIPFKVFMTNPQNKR